MATVLLLVVAATIVLVVSTQAINATHAESNRSDLAQATLEAHNAASAFETKLAANPYFFYSTVFSATVGSSTYAEKPRICDQGSANVSPGSPWSIAACGTYWTYSSRTSSPAPTAWLQITPPHLDAPSLVVHILATVGSASDGLTLTFRMNGTENYTLWSSSSLDVTSLPGNPSLTGPVYSTGSITTPSSSASNATSLLGAAQLEAELGFPNSPVDPSARYYSASPTPSSSPPVSDIRSVVPEVLTSQSLRSSLADTYSIACPGGTPWYDTVTSSASALCITAGGTVVTSSTSTATIPANASAYLLVFASTSPVVSLYYTTRPAPLKIDTQCSAYSCDLATDSSFGGPADVANGSHPGQLNSWTFLATVPLPTSGLVFADHDVQLGTCSAGSDTPFLTAGASCPSLTAGSLDTGMDVSHSVTVMAGTAASPANVWIGTSIFATNNASFGAIATGQVFVPYWAHSPYSTSTSLTSDPTVTPSSMELDGAYAALGYGIDVSTTSPIAPWPSDANLYTSSTQNLATSLTLNGSLASPDLSVTTPMTSPLAPTGPFAPFSTVALSNANQFVTNPPPYFTDFDGLWSLTSASRYTIAQACGANVLSC